MSEIHELDERGGPPGPAVFPSTEYAYRGWFDAVRADGTRAYAFQTLELAQEWAGR